MNRAFYTLIIMLIVTAFFGQGVQATTAFSGSPDSTYDIEFIDIKDHWARPDIEKLRLKGAAFGYSDSTYHPDSPISRLDGATMLVKIIDPEFDGGASGFSVDLPFNDIHSLGLDQRRYISRSIELGLLKGDAGGETFRPNSPINRIEAAVIMVRALGYEGEALARSNQEVSLSFSDERNIPSWSRGYVSVAVEKELVKGYEDNTFRGNRFVSRGEFAVLSNRLDKYIVNSFDNKDLSGRIMAIKTTGTNRMNVRLDSGIIRDYRVDRDVLIFKDQKVINFDELQADMTVDFLVDDSQSIVFIEVNGEKPNLQIKRVLGKIDSVNTTSRDLKIDSDFPIENKSIKVNTDSDTLVYINGRKMNFADLKSGMNIIAVGERIGSDEIKATMIEAKETISIQMF